MRTLAEAAALCAHQNRVMSSNWRSSQCITAVILIVIFTVIIFLVFAGIITAIRIPCGPVNISPPELNKAIREGNEQKAHELIQEGKDVNATECNGTTALQLAAGRGYTDLVEELLEKDAGIDYQDNDGQTALIKASIFNHSAIVRRLVNHTANLDIQDKLGETALIHASWEGNVEIVKILIEAKASVNIRERGGQTALFKATQRGWIKICLLLIRAGIYVDAQDFTEETALHNAAVTGNVKLVTILFETGEADACIVDLNGNTPEMLADIYGNNDVADYLRHHAICTSPCGPLSIINGMLIYQAQNETLTNATVFYTCNSGYALSGNNMRSCQVGGEWAGSNPSCNPVDCGTLTNPANGSVDTPQETTFDQMATYSCNSGYSLVGNTTRTCQADGVWSGSSPTCAVECGTLTNPANGRVDTPQGTIFEHTATYRCNSGYSLVGNTTRTCQANGLWSGSSPTCVVDCGTLTNPASGRVDTPQGTTFEQMATYSCNSRYSLVGSMTRICQANGVWSGSQPTCAVECGTLTNPANGRVDTPQGTTFEHTATYRCNSGYSLVGNTTRTCQANGLWSGSSPTCVVDCGTLTNPASGRVDTPQGTTFEHTATYSCNSGYSLVGSMTRTCQANGVWSGSQPTCAKLSCDILMDPDGGSVVLTGRTIGSEANYNCREGFSLQGNMTRTCQPDGMWSGNEPTCEATHMSTHTSISTTMPTNIPTRISTTMLTNIPTRISTTMPTNIPTRISTTMPTNISSRISTTMPTNISSRISTTMPTNVPTRISTTMPTSARSQNALCVIGIIIIVFLVGCVLLTICCCCSFSRARSYNKAHSFNEAWLQN